MAEVLAKTDTEWMEKAAFLALGGLGFVEPNPMVGCIVVDRSGNMMSSGFHRTFGGPHAEVDAIDSHSGDLSGATVYVTLEPCSHHGKTPPCADFLVNRRPECVVFGERDPNPLVSGRGLERLRESGIRVRQHSIVATRELIRPFAKLQLSRRPWIIAKWACSMDGKVATRMGESQWISSEASRADVHRTRGRVDAILTGIGTVLADDPLLTARPAGQRVALRVVVDSVCRLPLASKLALTAREFPTLVLVGPGHDSTNRRKLESCGIEVVLIDERDPGDRLQASLDLLGARSLTNVLVESGGTLLGSLADCGEIDEVHAYIAPILIGGEKAPGPVMGQGIGVLGDRTRLEIMQSGKSGSDIRIVARRQLELPP